MNCSRTELCRAFACAGLAVWVVKALIKGIAALVGGGGGGRPNMAQAGGKNPEGVAAALEKVLEVVEGQIK